MASVKIDSGQLPSADGVPEGYELSRIIGRWQSIANGQFPDYCAKLLQMIDETDRLRLWEKNIGGFTYESRDEFLRKKVLIDFDLTEQSLTEIVRRLRGGEQVTLTLRAKAGAPEDAPRDEAGRFVRSNPDNVRIGYGNSAAYTIARLDRDNPELAAAVREGRISANAAAIQAGWRKQLTPLEQFARLWRKCSEEERMAIREFIDSPVFDR